MIRHRMMPRTEKLLTSFTLTWGLVVVRESIRVRMVKATARATK